MARPPRPGGNLAISASQGIALGLGALSTFVLARVLGPSGRGGLSLLQAMSALVATLCLLGTPTLIVRRHLLGPARGLVAPAVLAAAACGFLVAVLMAAGYLRLASATLQEGGVTVAALVAAAVNAAILVGREGFAAHLQSGQRFHRLALWRVVWAAAPLAAVLLVLPWHSGASFLFVVTVVMNIALTIALAPFFKRFAPRARRFYRRVRLAPRTVVPETVRLWGTAASHQEVRVAFGSHIALTLLLLVYRVDVLLLGALSTASAVGLYSIAYVTAELPWLIVNGYAVTLLPRLLTKDAVEKRRLHQKALLQSLTWALVVVLCIALVGRPTFDLLLGSSFSGSYTAFLLLAPGILAFIPFKLLATQMIAAGTPWRLSGVCLSLLALNVLLNLLLDGRFGVNGCAAAASATYLLAVPFYVPMGRHALATEESG
ncbi:MAG TPA: oligosaccharide flippase family protein [Solirubrobacterales bacterium]|nr:oligosaccharide flippase family protein [Solirubrobacterales bacterium]